MWTAFSCYKIASWSSARLSWVAFCNQTGVRTADVLRAAQGELSPGHGSTQGEPAGSTSPGAKEMESHKGTRGNCKC